MTEKKRYVYIEMTDEQYQAQSAVLSNLKKVGQRICNADIEKAYEHKIDSLITTIESLQTQNLVAQLANGSRIETLGNLVEDQRRLIESQKEEIEQLKFNLDIHIKAVNVEYETQSEIESLKAITELAVKGLEEVKWNADVAEFVSLDGANNFKEFISGMIQTKLDEIERLFHEQNS